MLHLIAPSSMREVAPTSIHSSSQKGMRTHHPKLSRSRRDTSSQGHEPAFARLMLGACFCLGKATFVGADSDGCIAPFLVVRSKVMAPKGDLVLIKAARPQPRRSLRLCVAPTSIPRVFSACKHTCATRVRRQCCAGESRRAGVTLQGGGN
jgi:hypothetical protein